MNVYAAETAEMTRLASAAGWELVGTRGRHARAYVPVRTRESQVFPYGSAGHYLHVSDSPRGPTTRGLRHDLEDSPIGHVLLDADGVIQHLPGGWYAAMEPYLGDRAREFLHRTWKDELPMLAGQGDYLSVLAATLAEYGVTVPVRDVYADVWHRIEIVGESVALVRSLRRNGYGVHLATNQESHRAAYMRDVLGYDALFDISCYSCDLGVAKPAPAFFAEAVRRIGTDPSAILFIDDSARNVEGARTAGLAAEQWGLDQGHEALARVLASWGVTGDSASVGQ